MTYLQKHKKAIQLLNNDKRRLREESKNLINKNYFKFEIYKINQNIQELKRGYNLEMNRIK
jgi:hypothetical protein